MTISIHGASYVVSTPQELVKLCQKLKIKT